VERGLTLEQLAEQTQLSKSRAGQLRSGRVQGHQPLRLIKLVKFFGVTADYLLGLTETKNHSNADIGKKRIAIY